MSLEGPSLKRDVSRLMYEAAEKLRAQADALDEVRYELHKDCKHEFDDGTCSTENRGLVDVCVICGR